MVANSALLLRGVALRQRRSLTHIYPLPGAPAWGMEDSFAGRLYKLGLHLHTSYEVLVAKRVVYSIILTFGCLMFRYYVVFHLTRAGRSLMVVRKMMNRTRVIKVYLIGTKKYAYRLKYLSIRRTSSAL